MTEHFDCIYLPALIIYILFFFIESIPSEKVESASEASAAAGGDGFTSKPNGMESAGEEGNHNVNEQAISAGDSQ